MEATARSAPQRLALALALDRCRCALPPSTFHVKQEAALIACTPRRPEPLPARTGRGRPRTRSLTARPRACPRGVGGPPISQRDDNTQPVEPGRTAVEVPLGVTPAAPGARVGARPLPLRASRSTFHVKQEAGALSRARLVNRRRFPLALDPGCAFPSASVVARSMVGAIAHRTFHVEHVETQEPRVNATPI